MTTKPARFSLLLLLALSSLTTGGGAFAEAKSADPSWLSSVSGEIETSEYRVTWQTETALADLPSAWQAPNRAQGFRTYFAGDGIRVLPRAAGRAASWE